MEPTTKSSSRKPLWVGIILTVLILALALVSSNLLPQAGRMQKPLVLAGQVGPFTLTNQFGQPVTLTNLLGRIWIADIIFTRCQSSCLNLTRRMASLQTKIPPPAPVQFVSLTADPDNDTPAILKNYAETHQADSARWQFLTGPKKELYRLAIEDLKFVVVDKTREQREPQEEMFLHSTLFVLVDRQGRLRGCFEGAEPEAQVQVVEAVQQLLKEK